MSSRGLLLLALLTALAVGALLLTRERTVDPPAAAQQPRFLPGLEERLDVVGRVAVRAPHGSELATVVRDGDAWVVANRWDYPADLVTLRGTLIGLARARRLEPKTDRPSGYARLGVAPPGSGAGSGLEVRLPGLEPPVAVLIGNPAAGEAGGTYVRRVEGDRAWLVSARLERHEEIADWLDSRLVDIEAGRIARVRLEPVDGEPVTVVSPVPGTARFELLDLPAGRRPLSRSIAESIARVVADLRLRDVVPAAGTDLPPPLAVGRFETAEGLLLEIEAFAAARRDAPERLVRLQAGALDGADAMVRARARRLDARFDGWLYRIPGYKFVNLTYSLDHVLEPE